ncbi:MAG: hypothetical protein K5773_05515 [Pseudobutyrivibrio sp.]|nr:hypothetical protein [Pseudobutyrivibrio sp.]
MKIREYRKRSKELNKLIKGSEANRSLYYKSWLTLGISLIGGFVAIWQLPDTIWGLKVHDVIPAILGPYFNLSQTLWDTITLLIFLLICALILAAVRIKKRMEFETYLHKRVEAERPGCALEIRVADSYLTNAFKNYPKSAMLIGINKTFLFEESEKGSLIDDMCKHFEELGVDKHQIQCQIDAVLERLYKEKGEEIIDQNRPWVMVKKTVPEGEEVRVGENDCAKRRNFKIGTIVGVDVKYVEGNVAKLKKLYLLANAEVIQGKDSTEPLKVNSDKYASVVESFDCIWDYFDQSKLDENPPESELYAPLLMPLIGGGVANEGYSDIEIFSRIVDLYYERLRDSLRKGENPAISQLIINIRNNTAIKQNNETNSSRKIDLNTAFWYIDYRNKVNPVKVMRKE